jgi:hypothetical protein
VTPAGSVGLYLVSLALGSFAGPLTLARFFDSVGRRPMIVTSLRRVGRAARRHGLLFRAGVLSVPSGARSSRSPSR